MQTVTLSLFRLPRWRDRAWAFLQMGAARLPLSAMPDLSFFKLMGSGSGLGFRPVPNTAVWAILCVWRDARAAARGLAAPVFDAWRGRADETMDLTMTPTASRGRWSRKAPFQPAPAADGPLASLTRGTIRPTKARRFWAHVPRIDPTIEPSAMTFRVGLGELPYLRQATFTLWPDAAAMARFARGDTPHARAIRAVREESLFSEDLYARFRVTGARGTWNGTPAEAFA
ncbi:spheroidene monooxygenase [Jannaschia sp. Os4]|uniref:spheroidene monooxygenase n=1 Tax=Jannaschia sp. Os4 TaxID=2807617 RepID=UPI00193A53D0|nr:spheroidene monooxygenase [Jannaschia sp. Os4]MBM2575598.1 spheroidene monooxygenase [Jannaschia sp. Os4]